VGGRLGVSAGYKRYIAAKRCGQLGAHDTRSDECVDYRYSVSGFFQTLSYPILSYAKCSRPDTTADSSCAYSAGDMYTMRERLLNDAAARDRGNAEELTRQIHETSDLTSTLAKLETAEDQLRTLQANLIAERVARTQIERENDTTSEDMRDCRNELASAVRALRRAREEGKRTDEERRRLARCFEETKTQ